jgi:hypothetical protein
MPTILWRGPERTVRTKYGHYDRHTPVEVSQAWLDERRGAFKDTHWQITDDYEGVTFTQDDGDGLPDENWLKADIQTWLADHGVQMSGVRATKAKMLERVDEVLAAEVATEEE